ncbi:hypothetical protein BC830DRAFT_1150921 [Chytriomyces sp. MP71]|nr:hypothetical protein BC830DRAFT_1150921 [Chytriomyces sp. MP71]
MFLTGDGVNRMSSALDAVPIPGLSSNNPKDFFEPMLGIGDPPADTLIALCFVQAGQDTVPRDPNLPSSLTSLMLLLNKESITAETASALATALHLTTATPWLAPARLARARRFYWCNAPLITLISIYASLGGGFGFPRLDLTLAHTGKLTTPRTVWLRLLRTARMTLHVMDPMGGLERVGGDAWWAVVKVRLVHALVRRRVIQAYPGLNHVPINQADMAATILSFQAVVLGNMMRLVRWWRDPLDLDEGMRDYTHLYRYVAHLSGVIEEANPCLNAEASMRLLKAYVHLYHGKSPDYVGEPLPEDYDPGATALMYLKVICEKGARKRPLDFAIAMLCLFSGDAITRRYGLLKRVKLYHTFRAYILFCWCTLFSFGIQFWDQDKFASQAAKSALNLLEKEIEKEQKLISGSSK